MVPNKFPEKTEHRKKEDLEIFYMNGQDPYSGSSLPRDMFLKHRHQTKYIHLFRWHCTQPYSTPPYLISSWAPDLMNYTLIFCWCSTVKAPVWWWGCTGSYVGQDSPGLGSYGSSKRWWGEYWPCSEGRGALDGAIWVTENGECRKQERWWASMMGRVKKDHVKKDKELG